MLCGSMKRQFSNAFDMLEAAIPSFSVDEWHSGMPSGRGPSLLGLIGGRPTQLPLTLPMQAPVPVTSPALGSLAHRPSLSSCHAPRNHEQSFHPPQRTPAFIRPPTRRPASA